MSDPTPLETTVGDAYTKVADLYIELFGDTERVHADDLAFLGRHLGSVKGPMLDAGCGPGHLTAYLHSLGRDVTGVDLSTAFIDHASKAHPQCRFRQESYAAGAEDTYQGILTWYSLIHTPPDRVDATLAQLGGRLETGGMLVLGVVEGPDLEPFDHKVTTAYFWSPDGAEQRLERAGFEIVEIERRPAYDQVRPHLAVAATRDGVDRFAGRIA
jgi:2-polyprenyl-3-methyl-5-hydroxy-6-metoxy-1,4-benzoquinol methylase